MIPRRTWLALAAGFTPSAVAAAAQARRSAPAGQEMVTVEMPEFEGAWARDADPDDLQALEYLASFKPYTNRPTPEQIAWLTMGQRMFGKDGNPNHSWRLYALYHGSRGGLRPGEMLEVACALNFLPESRIAAPSGRLPVRLDPWFTFERALKSKPRITLVVESAAGKPLGQERILTPERLESRELSLEFDAPSDTEVFARYTLAAEDGTVYATVRRAVLLQQDYRRRVEALLESGKKLMLGRPGESVWRGIGARTVLRRAERYQAALSGYAVPYPERMHPFVATVMNDSVPRTWTSSVGGERELKPLEELATKLTGSGEPGVSDLTTPTLVWTPTESPQEESFRVLLPEGFTADRKWPLVVALHPEFGDQGSLADMFLGPDGKTGLLVEEARKRGYIVLLPSAGSAFGWLAEPALTRLPGLVRRFVETWPIDPGQVFLWGHSLGASLAYRMLNLRNLWAAAAVVAGLPQRTYDYNTPADIPLALISGGNDLTVPPRQMLVVSYRLQRVIKQREIITLEGQDHWSAGAAGIPAAFRFFDAVRKAAPAAAPK